MKLIHVTRNSPNWLDLEKDYESHQIKENIKNNMRKIFKQWNLHLKPSYFIFRNWIVEIAKNNHKKIKADLYFQTALNIQDNIKEINDKYIVLFTDDDDWNHPNIANFLFEFYHQNPDVDAIQWNHCAFCSNFQQFKNNNYKEPYFILTNNTSFHTNNYVLTDNFFKKFNSTEDIHLLNYGKDWDIYYGHTNIDIFFKDKINFKKIPNYLSVASKTISSYSYWWENDASKLIDIIEICTKGSYQTIPSQIEWAKEEVLETLNAYKKLKFKKTII